MVTLWLFSHSKIITTFYCCHRLKIHTSKPRAQNWHNLYSISRTIFTTAARSPCLVHGFAVSCRSTYAEMFYDSVLIKISHSDCFPRNDDSNNTIPHQPVVAPIKGSSRSHTIGRSKHGLDLGPEYIAIHCTLQRTYVDEDVVVDFGSLSVSSRRKLKFPVVIANYIWWLTMLKNRTLTSILPVLIIIKSYLIPIRQKIRYT